jgi:hypothetical protein
MFQRIEGSSMRTKRTRTPSLEQLETRLVPSTYYVATTGNDSNNGSAAHPFKTMQHAMISLEPGDTLDVEAGSYAGFIVGWDSTPANTGDRYGWIDGTPSAPITIQADPSAAAGSVIINSRNNETSAGVDLEPGDNYIVISGFNINDSTGGVDKYPNKGEGVKICGTNDSAIGNTITNINYGFGIIADNASNVVLRSNTITGTLDQGNADYGHGVYISGSTNGAIVQGNTIYSNQYIGIHVNGDASEGGIGLVTNALIEDNVIYNNGQNGINCDGIEDSTIENNLIDGYADCGICIYQSDAAGPSSGNTIVNNTITSTVAGSGAAIRMLDGAINNTVLNNILLGDDGNTYRISSDSVPGLVSNYNVVSPNVQSDDNGSEEAFAQWQAATNQDSHSLLATSSQIFDNAPDGNYQELPTAPSIGAGTSEDAPAADIDGNARPSSNGYDIGCYESEPSFSINPGAATAGLPLDITVTALLGGSTNTGFAGTVTLTSSDPHASLPGAYAFTSGDQGVHTFPVTLETAGTQTVTVTDNSNGSDTGAARFSVSAAAASTFTVAGAVSPTVAGKAHPFTVTAYDPYGNVATGYAGTATFTSSSPKAILPANYTFKAGDAGHHTFSVTLSTSGTQSVTATDNSNATITGSQTGIVVTPGNATWFQITGLPGGTLAGTTKALTLIARDAYGNVASGYTGTVAFTSSDPQAVLPAAYTFIPSDAGMHAFAPGVMLKTAGEQTVTAIDTANSSLNGTRVNYLISAASASTLTLVGFPATVVAGSAQSFLVKAWDPYGNIATGYKGVIRFTSTDPKAIRPANYTFTATDAGQHSFSATFKTAGSQSITATSTSTASITGQASISILGGPATLFVLSGLPGGALAGATKAFTLIAKDAYGNVATGYTGTVAFTSSDPQAVLPAAYTFVPADAGMHAFAPSVTLKTAGEQTVTATDTLNSALTGKRVNYLIVAAAAAKVLISGFPSPVAAGTPGSFSVTVQDLYGNTVTGYTGTIHFTSSDRAANLPANYIFTAGDAGIHTFSASLNTSGTQSITATDTVHPAISGSEGGIQVTDASMPATAPELDSRLNQDDDEAGDLARAVVAPTVQSDEAVLVDRFFSESVCREAALVGALFLVQREPRRRVPFEAP